MLLTALIVFLLQKSQDEKSPVGPYLLAFFIFVVCGSGTYTCINYV